MGSIFKKIAEQRASNAENGVHQEIPFTGLDDGGKNDVTAQDKSPKKDSDSSVKDLVTKPEEPKPGQFEAPPVTTSVKFNLNKKPIKVAGSTSVSTKTVSPPAIQAGPPSVDNVKPSTKPVVQEQVAVVTQTAAPPVILKVEDDTFNRGTEKYTQEEVDDLKTCIGIIQSSFENPEMLRESIKTVMLSTLENPNLCDVLGEQDIGIMVQAMRMSRDVHVAKSGERKTKRAKTAERVEQVADDLADILAGMGPQ